MQLPVSISCSLFVFFEFLFNSCVLTHDLIYVILVSSTYLCVCALLLVLNSELPMGLIQRVPWTQLQHMYVLTLELDTCANTYVLCVGIQLPAP